MNGFLPDPTRWKDRTDQANLAERAAGRAIRSLDNPEPLATIQLARIAARIRSERSSPRPRRFWLTATAALLVCGAAMASAAHMKILPRWLTGIESPRPMPAPATPSSRPKSRVPHSVPAPTDLPAAKSDDAPAVAAEPSKVFDPTQPRVTTRKAVQRPLAMRTFPAQNPIPVVPPPPPPSEAPPTAVPLARPFNTPSDQSAWVQMPAERYLTKAIRALRVEQSPEAALALLDRHSPALDKSDFRHEALLLRVEALLKLHRHTDVLRLLEATPLTDVPASRTLLLTRGELRAAAGHCMDAMADFDRVLAQTQGHDRRALLGLAKCHKQMGNEANSRAEMER